MPEQVTIRTPRARPTGTVRPLGTAGPTGTADESRTADDAGTAGDAGAGPATPSALAADLRVALMRSVRRIRTERIEDGLPDSQYSVLALIERMEPTTPTALAEAEHVQPPSMTRTVGALVEAGVVDRGPHPEDGRQVLLTTTEAGRELLRATRRRRDQWLTRRLTELTPHERAVLAEAAEVLRRVVAR